MNKVDKIGFFNKDTGEAIDKEQFDAISKEEMSKTIKALCWKIENEPFNMSLDELNMYRILVKKKKGKIIKYKIEAGEFTTLIMQDIKLIKSLDTETMAMLYRVSMIINKSGILVYENNKPIPSFEAFKNYLEIGHSKWSKIKNDIDRFDIIVKRKDKNNRNILLANPLFTTSSREVTEMKFITFGHLLKEKLDFEDYLYLCKIYDIVPEYEKQNEINTSNLE